LFPLLAADGLLGGAQPARFSVAWPALLALMLVVRPLGQGIGHKPGVTASGLPQKVLLGLAGPTGHSVTAFADGQPFRPFAGSIEAAVPAGRQLAGA